MINIVTEELTAILAAKGEAYPPLTQETVLLGADLPLDSLDLATLIVTLEERTGREPFAEGFRMFHTLGELAALFEAAAP
jgi:acyl carrier protein